MLASQGATFLLNNMMTAIRLSKGSASMHYLQTSGATTVAGSHWLNRRLCRGCGTCRSHHASKTGWCRIADPSGNPMRVRVGCISWRAL